MNGALGRSRSRERELNADTAALQASRSISGNGIALDEGEAVG
jgi:hypothetical protein